MKKYKIQEGKYLGAKLKIIEEQWVDNNFQISDHQVDKIVNILESSSGRQIYFVDCNAISP